MKKNTLIIFIECYPLFEEALEDCDEYDYLCDRIRDFLIDDLYEFYDNVRELRDNINYIEVPI